MTPNPISTRPNRYPTLSWEQRIVGADLSAVQAPDVGGSRAAVTHANRRAVYGAGSPLTVDAGGKFDFGDGSMGDDVATNGRLVGQWVKVHQVEVDSSAAIGIALIVTDSLGHAVTLESLAGVTGLFRGGPNTILLAPDQTLGITTTGLAGADVCRARVVADVWVRKEGY